MPALDVTIHVEDPAAARSLHAWLQHEAAIGSGLIELVGDGVHVDLSEETSPASLARALHRWQTGREDGPKLVVECGAGRLEVGVADPAVIARLTSLFTRGGSG